MTWTSRRARSWRLRRQPGSSKTADRLRVCLTGGIACGKSLLSRFLNELGVGTIDADDVVHEILPDPAERKRIAAEVFADPAKRRALEARLHPLVRARIAAFLAETPGALAVIPLLFEVHWEADYDIIACVTSPRELQLERMMTARGYSRAEAESRLAAQLPVAEKAEKSHYVIRNDGSAADLRREAERFVSWLRETTSQRSSRTWQKKNSTYSPRA